MGFAKAENLRHGWYQTWLVLADDERETHLNARCVKMKWIVLAAILLLAALLPSLFKSNRKALPIAAFALGLLPFIEYRFHLLAAPISWAGWAGTVKGVEVSFMDAIAIAMLASTQRVRSPVVLVLTLVTITIAYFIALIINPMKMPQLFFGWEILRSTLVFMAVMRASVVNDEVPPALVSGLIIGVIWQAAVVALQYAGGESRAGGWLGTSNLLGFSIHFVAYPAFALFLGGYYRGRTLLAVLAACVIAFAGASRATVGLFLPGLLLTAVFSCMHRTTGRKTAMISAAVVASLVLAPVLLSSLHRRSAEETRGSSQMRDSMNLAASMIIADHPFGVGANKYVVVANVGGYAERAGLPWSSDNRAAPVHNTYYLATAEMGWLGLLGIVLLFASSFGLAFNNMRRAPASFGGELAAGLAATMAIIAVHSYFEWIFMMHVGHILLALTLGLMGALHAKLRVRPRPVMAASTPGNLLTMDGRGIPSL